MGDSLCRLLPALRRAEEKDITLPDIIGIPVELLRAVTSVGDDVCWEAKRRDWSRAEGAGSRSKAPVSPFIRHR